MSPAANNQPLSVASLFSGIGGIELGLHSVGHHTEFQCEVMPAAQAVLRKKFPSTRLENDISSLKSLPKVDMVAAGFPCQDLSQAGQTKGIRGHQSSLIDYVFGLIRKRKASRPEWLLIENVPFMLQLDRGRGMRHLTSQVSDLGYNWAYRVVDARSFGLPQRRRRVIFLASRSNDPRDVVLADDIDFEPEFDVNAEACGFYWTEGNTGLGWTNDGVPTLKGGSSLGIPSPPGIWLRNTDEIVTPDIRDAERLQGFPVNWTLPAMETTKKIGARWKLVGNAVSVPVSKWIGRNLISPRRYESSSDEALSPREKWPSAGWSVDGEIHKSGASEWPKQFAYSSLAAFLKYPPQDLSFRATTGFFRRLQESSLRRPAGFDSALDAHIRKMADSIAVLG